VTFPQWFYIIYLFMIGSCVGSFLNVVVYRLPRGQSIVSPPSRCPKCEHRLAWFDNIPIFGWIFLGGKCRYCRAPISARYPIIEAVTGSLFSLIYIAIFIGHFGPFIAEYDHNELMSVQRMSALSADWPIFGLYLVTAAALLAASLIDAELYLIPPGIPIVISVVALLVHTIADHVGLPGALVTGPAGLALAAGTGLGLLLSFVLLKLRILPLSFPEGAGPLEIDKINQKHNDEPLPELTGWQVRKEIAKEFLFLTPPVLLGLMAVLLQLNGSPLHSLFVSVSHISWLSGFLGSILGGLVGGGIVWAVRVVGSFVVGREAMGLGDVDLMFAAGCVLGPGPAIAAFFIGPFLAVPVNLVRMLLKSRHELPYGPYLSMAIVIVMLFYFPFYHYYRTNVGPAYAGFGEMLRQLL